MKLAIRVIVLTCLMAVAVTMAVFTLADFRRSAAEPTGVLMLGSYDGSVAVFDSGNRETPLRVTEIELDSLRAADRKIVEAGVTVSSPEELMVLLEDLGS